MLLISIHPSEYDILIDIVQKILTNDLLALLSLLQFGYLLGLLRVLLLVVQHLLQPEEVLTGLLIQLLVDVAVDRDELGHHYVLEGVHSAVCHLDLLVQGQERRLKGCNSDQQIEDASELFPAFLYGETTTFQPDLTHRILRILKLLKTKVGNEHTGNILLTLIKPNSRSLDSLRYFPSN